MNVIRLFHLITNFIIDNMGRFYHSFNENKIPTPEPLRIHYKDYSTWQNALLESPDMARKTAGLPGQPHPITSAASR